MDVDGDASTASGAGAASARAASAASFSSAASAVRKDGRSNSHLRPFVSDVALLNRADGSARLSAGGSSVLVAVYGPKQPKSARMAKPDRASIEVVVKPPKGVAGPPDKELEEVTRSTLESMVLLALHPRAVISVIVQVLSADGSVVALALNAATLALVDAGVPISGMFTANCAGLTRDGHVLLDPTAEEEKVLRAVCTCGFSNKAPAEPVTMLLSGLVSDEELDELRTSAQRACESILAFLSLAIKRKVFRDAGVEALPGVESIAAAAADPEARGEGGGARAATGAGGDDDSDDSDDAGDGGAAVAPAP